MIKVENNKNHEKNYTEKNDKSTENDFYFLYEFCYLKKSKCCF